jgi:molybdopterin-guanine dinucleotide biosynthesis protein B
VDIVAGRAAPSDCRSLGPKLAVAVNGQPLGMNPFVEKIISGAIRAMLAELKGYAPGRIDISLEG